MVRSLPQYGAAVDKTSRSGRTILCYAVHNGRKDVVRILIEHNADVTHNSEGGFVAAEFVPLRSDDIFELVIERGADENRSNDLRTNLPMFDLRGSMYIFDCAVRSRTLNLHNVSKVSTLHRLRTLSIEITKLIREIIIFAIGSNMVHSKKSWLPIYIQLGGRMWSRLSPTVKMN